MPPTKCCFFSNSTLNLIPCNNGFEYSVSYTLLSYSENIVIIAPQKTYFYSSENVMALKPLHNETELLDKITRGDQRAFTELFKAYARPLATFVQTLTSSTEITEEIIQDCFVKIWLRRGSLDQIESFTGYLYILCRNHTFAQLKKIAEQRSQSISIESHILDEIKFEDLDNPAEEYRKLIEQSVMRLPEQQRKVYMLSRYERKKHDEIAREMGLSPETVKKYIMYAVEFIRKDVGTTTNMGILIVLTTSLAGNNFF